MTLVRQRRRQRGLKLDLPQPATTFQRPADLLATSSWSAVSSPGTPVFEGLADLEKLELLGRGNSGNVYQVREKNTLSIFALKVLHAHKNAAAFRQQAAREAEIFRQVDSPFIVRCYAVFDSNDGLCFAMELMERGSIKDVLCKCKVLSEDVVSRMATCVLQGLRYLHGLDIVHGDIKPSNLLINTQGNVKIADFGVSRTGASKCGCSYDLHMGTCAYMSPERIEPELWDYRDDSGGSSAGFAGDVWSLGVVVLECLVGHYPLIGVGEKPDWAALVCAICFGERLEMPKHSSPEFASFVRRCLEKDWRKRGTVEELLYHPFVRENHISSERETYG